MTRSVCRKDVSCLRATSTLSELLSVVYHRARLPKQCFQPLYPLYAEYKGELGTESCQRKGFFRLTLSDVGSEDDIQREERR